MNTETPTSDPATGWPELSVSRTEPCDGVHPETTQPCVLGYHGGYHRDTSGTEWLDD